jgi:hypothetical protein
MKIHIHNNNDPSPEKHNCLIEDELSEGKVLSLHMHAGECRPCRNGHCHDGTINLVMVDNALYVVFEKVVTPDLITLSDAKPHGPVAHGESREKA